MLLRSPPRPKSSQHSGWTVFEAAFMARCSGARMGWSATGCLCHLQAICPPDRSTCRDRETSESRVIRPLSVPSSRADSFEQCLRGLNPDQSPASTIPKPVAKATGFVVLRGRCPEIRAAFPLSPHDFSSSAAGWGVSGCRMVITSGAAGGAIKRPSRDKVSRSLSICLGLGMGPLSGL